MNILILVTGEYGWRHVRNIEAHCPAHWQVQTWQTPRFLPPVMDYPEDYLPETLPASDLILSLAEVKGVAELIPEIAKMTHAQAVIAPIDNVAWLPVGLARQLGEWLTRLDVACVTPKPFCSLSQTHYNVLRYRVAYDHPLIREFAHHFGQPAFKVTINSEKQSIADVEVTCDTGCGCGRYVAEKLRDTQLSESVMTSGLLHHHYPCQASMGIDTQYQDTLMHISGNIMKDAVQDAIRPFFKPNYIRPDGHIDES